MFLFRRKALAAIGIATTAATTLFASPAQAATVGKAQVLGTHNSIVEFTAAAGRSNSLVITISGRTVTLNDRVAIKAGKGCKAVKGDRTKVRCTTSRKPTELSVVLGNKNDKVYNKTGVLMVAEGGSGNDTLSGGSHRDRLFGGSGNDKLYGGAGIDAIDGESGNDYIVGGRGNDWLDGDVGADTIRGGYGNDAIAGGPGADTLIGQAGNDKISGGPGNDVITGGPGKDQLSGGAGKDKITQ
jgi:Ca2+-binding RTX toxin-like protein